MQFQIGDDDSGAVAPLPVPLVYVDRRASALEILLLELNLGTWSVCMHLIVAVEDDFDDFGISIVTMVLLLDILYQWSMVNGQWM